jgi:hypothetical protein
MKTFFMFGLFNEAVIREYIALKVMVIDNW